MFITVELNSQPSQPPWAYFEILCVIGVRIRKEAVGKVVYCIVERLRPVGGGGSSSHA